MNICIIGNFSGNADEGMKLVAQNLASELSETQNILKIDIYSALRFGSLRRLRKFRPDVLHYISGPSPMSFIILQTLCLICKIQSHGRIKTVMSATQPWLPFNTGSVFKKFKPDLILSQSKQNKEYFENLGFNVKYLPNGVDLEKFKPVNNLRKQELRRKYGLSDTKFIMLHVGSVRKRRGLEVMKSVAKLKDWKVLIIGTTSSPSEKRLFSELVSDGCIVWRKYIGSINEIYQLADLYVFPVSNQLGCIEFPLSVLEAMACNLPVITTRFGGFPQAFNEGEGFFFVDKKSQISKKIRNISSNNVFSKVQTRNKVMPFSWDNISNRLIEYYDKLLN